VFEGEILPEQILLFADSLTRDLVRPGAGFARGFIGAVEVDEELVLRSEAGEVLVGSQSLTAF
jgi:hypothetical protein